MAPLSLYSLVLGLQAVSALQIPFLPSQLGQVKLSPDSLSGETSKKQLIDTEALQALIKPEKLLHRAKELYEIAKLSEDEYNHPTRVIGSKGHLATIDYIYSTIANLGDYYTLSNQSFDAVTGNIFESRLVIGQDVIKDARPMGLTPPTKDKEPVYGQVLLADHYGCDLADFPKDIKKPWIALVSRGKCPFGDKSDNAGKAGAHAAIIFNNEAGELSGTLGTPTPHHVATFGISDVAAKPVLEQLGAGKYVDSIAYIDAIVSTIKTTNILAQTAGDCDAQNVNMLGGHSDSVAEGPGINDDGSGSISLLEVATQLTNFKVKNCVRFGWWAGEEEGLLGSNYYVSQLSEEENQRIRVFMDYDMMASPNFAYQIYDATNTENPNGSGDLKELYVDWYREHGLNYTFIPFDGRSDYDAFIRNGIPGGGIATGAEGIKTEAEALQFGGTAGLWFDPCYHQLCDDVGNVNMTAWEVNTKLIAHSVAVYAKSWDGFPEREKEEAVQVKGKRAPEYKYRGHKLVL